MNKKIFVLLLSAIFLIASIGFISAENLDDDSTDDVEESSHNLKDIKVKKVWDDNGFESERPKSVQVELYVGGNLIDKAILNNANDWKTTFKDVDVSGDVKVVETGPSSDYKISYSGNADDGFVITSKITKSSVNDDILGKSDDSDNLTDDENTSQNQNDALDNVSDDSNNSSQNQNSTDDSVDDNSTDNKTINKTTNITETTIINKTVIKTENKNVNKTVIVNKEKVPPKKPPAKKNPVNLRNTGLPILVLVIVAIGAVFFSVKRKK